MSRLAKMLGALPALNPTDVGGDLVQGFYTYFSNHLERVEVSPGTFRFIKPTGLATVKQAAWPVVTISFELSAEAPELPSLASLFNGSALNRRGDKHGLPTTYTSYIDLRHDPRQSLRELQHFAMSEYGIMQQASRLFRPNQ